MEITSYVTILIPPRFTSRARGFYESMYLLQAAVCLAAQWERCMWNPVSRQALQRNGGYLVLIKSLDNVASKTHKYALQVA